MSLTGITLVIWRHSAEHQRQHQHERFLPAFQEKLDKEGVEGRAAASAARRTDIIPRRLFVAGLDMSKQGLAAMRRAMANVIELEILPDLNFLLPPILAIAKIATMVGLLGTVISMIGTFNAIGEAVKKGGSAAEPGGAIGLALFATALGLVTAIPLVFAHVLFKAWVAKFEVSMKSAAQKLILLVQSHKPPRREADDGDETGRGRGGGGDAGLRNSNRLAASVPRAPAERSRNGSRLTVSERLPWPRSAGSSTSGSSNRNTVYQEVPFTVVADWIQQGRLLEDDSSGRPAPRSGCASASIAGLRPYLPKAEPHARRGPGRGAGAGRARVRLEHAHADDEDDDVDMIPLIDVSLVLLIFFMLTASGVGGHR